MANFGTQNVNIKGNTTADGWENPFGTGAGQIVVSPQESWQARLARLGATRSQYTGTKLAMVQGVTTTVMMVRPAVGNQAYITHASISADGPGVAYIGFGQGNDSYYYTKYIPAGGSLDIQLDGVIMVRNQFELKFKADNAGTNAVGGCIWLEVHE